MDTNTNYNVTVGRTSGNIDLGFDAPAIDGKEAQDSSDGKFANILNDGDKKKLAVMNEFDENLARTVFFTA